MDRAWLKPERQASAVRPQKLNRTDSWFELPTERKKKMTDLSDEEKQKMEKERQALWAKGKIRTPEDPEF